MIVGTSLKKFSIILKKDIHEEVFDDGGHIFEEVFNDGDDIFEEVFGDGDDIFEVVFVEIKERSYLVIKAKEVDIVEEVIWSDGL